MSHVIISLVGGKKVRYIVIYIHGCHTEFKFKDSGSWVNIIIVMKMALLLYYWVVTSATRQHLRPSRPYVALVEEGSPAYLAP